MDAHDILQCCGKFYKKIFDTPDIAEISWRCKQVNVVVRAYPTEKNELLRHQLQEKIGSLYPDRDRDTACECIPSMIELAYLCGKNGPVIGNYPSEHMGTIKDNITDNDGIFAFIYDHALGIYNGLISNQQTYYKIRPIIYPMCNKGNDKASSDICVANYESIIQQYADNYWSQLHEVFDDISCEWNKAGKCHSVRQKLRKLSSLYPYENTKAAAIKLLICQLDKFCIPFEHTNLSNRIYVIIDVITDLHAISFSCELFIKICKSLLHIISLNKTIRCTESMLAQL
jgi:hypothetical protein